MTGKAFRKPKRTLLWKSLLCPRGLQAWSRRKKPTIEISPPCVVESKIIEDGAFEHPRPAPVAAEFVSPPYQKPPSAFQSHDLPPVATYGTELEDEPLRCQQRHRDQQPRHAEPILRGDEIEGRLPLRNASAGQPPWQRAGVDVDNFLAIAALRCLSLQVNPSPRSVYRYPRQIGQGAWGSVWSAHQIGTGARVAIKRVNLSGHPKKKWIMDEIHVLKKSNHRNIVGYIGSYIHQGEVWIIMEYMAGGNLTDVLAANHMTEGQIAAVCREVTMSYPLVNGSH
jgi:hypothetical protein